MCDHTNGSEDDAVKAECCAVDLAEVRLADECSHK
jgi:hypothetical protein